MENKNLPSLQDLYNDSEVAIKESQLNILLNHEPKKEWLKKHPIAKDVLYIPIQRIEYLLTNIFQVWNVEVKEIKLIANSVVVTIRLYYKNPLTGTMFFQDGIGAAPLQTDKDAGAIEFNKIKSNAVMLAAPSAESFAVKDAAEKIGKIFGKDLNRSDEIMYNNLDKKFKKEGKLLSDEKIAEIQKLISELNCSEEERIELEMESITLTTITVNNFMIKLKDKAEIL